MAARVVRMDRRLPPVEPSGFSILDRDLTHIVFVHLDVPCLCLLKCVSRSVANACRRTLRSAELYDDELYDDNSQECGRTRKEQARNAYYEIKQCICSSSLAMPFQVRATPHPFISYPENLDDDQGVIELVVHEFHLEFYLRDKRVTDPSEVIRWFKKAWKNVHNDDHNYTGIFTAHEENMIVECSRMTVERPGIGIFHSVSSLWDHIHFGELQRTDVGGELDVGGEPCWAVSSQKQHLPLELFLRLWPYVEYSQQQPPITFDNFNIELCTNAYHDGHVEGSLLFCFLRDRIVGTPFNRV
jgi:hypothetical protein